MNNTKKNVQDIDVTLIFAQLLALMFLNLLYAIFISFCVKVHIYPVAVLGLILVNMLYTKCR